MRLRALSYISVGIQIATTTLEGNLTISNKTTYALTFLPNNLILGIYFEQTPLTIYENTCAHA